VLDYTQAFGLRVGDETQDMTFVYPSPPSTLRQAFPQCIPNTCYTLHILQLTDNVDRVSSNTSK
jgi:hypothetical protein